MRFMRICLPVEETDCTPGPRGKIDGETLNRKPLLVSVSPHIKGEETTSRIMWSVSVALFPTTLMGAYFFGPRALYVVALCIIASVVSEYIFQRVAGGKNTIHDGSAFLTGLLLGLNLPPAVPFYIPIAGSFVAIIISKQLFGGLGYNIFNPALIGRAFLLVSFPKAMTVWSPPTSAFVTLDATSAATPLGILKEQDQGGGRIADFQVSGSQGSFIAHCR